jgi:hypothetical protein
MLLIKNSRLAAEVTRVCRRRIGSSCSRSGRRRVRDLARPVGVGLAVVVERAAWRCWVGRFVLEWDSLWAVGGARCGWRRGGRLRRCQRFGAGVGGIGFEFRIVLGFIVGFVVGFILGVGGVGVWRVEVVVVGVDGGADGVAPAVGAEGIRVGRSGWTALGFGTCRRWCGLGAVLFRRGLWRGLSGRGRC